MLYEDRKFIAAVNFGCLDMDRTADVIRDLVLSPHQRGEVGIYP